MKRLIKYKKFLEDKNSFILLNPNDDSLWELDESTLKEYFYDLTDEYVNIEIENLLYPSITDRDHKLKRKDGLIPYNIPLNKRTVDIDTYFIAYKITLNFDDNTNTKLNKQLKNSLLRLKNNSKYLRLIDNFLFLNIESDYHWWAFDLGFNKITIDQINDITFDENGFNFNEHSYNNIIITVFQDQTIEFSIRDVLTLQNINTEYDKDNNPYTYYTVEELINKSNIIINHNSSDEMIDAIVNDDMSVFWDIFEYIPNNEIQMNQLKYDLNDENKNLLVECLIKEIPDLIKDYYQTDDINGIKEQIKNDLTKNSTYYNFESKVFAEVHHIRGIKDAEQTAQDAFIYLQKLIEDSLIKELPIVKVEHNDESFLENKYKFKFNSDIKDHINRNIVNNGNLIYFENYKEITEDYLASTINVIEISTYFQETNVSREEYNDEVFEYLNIFLKTGKFEYY